MSTTYADFLASKAELARGRGPDVSPADVHPMLHDWQNELVRWACHTSRAALWADTGLGKTMMQLEWARLVTDRPALIVAPLAVCAQTVREAAKLGITAEYVRDPADATARIMVTNYEMIERFDPAQLGAVVLDEASILKQSDGKTRSLLIRHFADVPHRLACTATPAPNDPEELTNQAEFLGWSTRVNMLAAYFIHDSDGWRVKGHARQPMMRWMASWAVALRKPSDLGYDDAGYNLPGLEISSHLLDVDVVPEGELFATDLGGVGSRAAIRRSTLTARVDRAVRLVRECEQDAGGEARLPARVLPREQGEMAAHAGAEGGSACGTAQAVRGGCGVPRADEPPSKGVAGSAPAAAESLAVWPDGRSGRADAGSGLRDLSREPAPRSDSEAAHRSRPLDEHGPWCPLRKVQPRVGAPVRRPDSGHGDVRLPHACRDQWVIWCGLNDEQDALAAALGDECRSIDGRTKLEDRVANNEAWIRGEFRILLVKPGMYSYGMNWQHCARMAFVGLSDSYEQYYQAIRRCYRYGQQRVVQAHIILSRLEGQIATNVRRKEAEAAAVTSELVDAMRIARQETAA